MARGHDRDVEGAIFQSQGEAFRCILDYLKFDFRVAGLKLADKFRQQIRRDGWNTANGQATGNIMFQIVKAAASLGNLDQNFARIFEQTFSALGDDDGSRRRILVSYVQ